MKVAVLKDVNQLAIEQRPDPAAGAGEVIVRLRAAALNHRDVWIKNGQYAGLKFPIVPGSDGAGVVTQISSGVESSWLGREVIINPAFDWGQEERAQGKNFTILGLPKDGTLAEAIHVPAAQLAPKPAHLSWEEAAALPLAGVTAWRALFSRAQLQPREKILINGIGAGTALFALQFAVAVGALPFVTSSSPEKLARARQLGAKDGVLYSGENWAKEFGAQHGPFDVIVDSAGGPGFGDLIDLCAPGGRMVFFGATRGNPPELPSRKIFWRQISVLGTTMGSPTDFAAMMDLVTSKAIHPVISEVFPLDRAGDAFALMERGGQFGKIVVRIE
ncbi:MAG: zinc-binding dehydrogenase [Verrucomicrobiia bacterium]